VEVRGGQASRGEKRSHRPVEGRKTLLGHFSAASEKTGEFEGCRSSPCSGCCGTLPVVVLESVDDRAAQKTSESDQRRPQKKGAPQARALG
jgi:hypothetical protein